MIIRLDDVSPNTDATKLEEIVSTISNFLPDAEIWLGVNFFARFEPGGSVYPNPPFKAQPIPFFFEVDRFLSRIEFWNKVCSHGLWHFDHTRVSPDLAEASIVTSCNLLRSHVFIPPFNKWDITTEQICRNHGIQLVKSEEEGWRSMEHNAFTPLHSKWYLHPWRAGERSLREYFSQREAALK